MDTQEIISSGILEMYAMGITTEAENLQVQEWLRIYPEVAAELSHIEIDMENFAQSNALTPSPDLKSKVLRSVQQVHFAAPEKIGGKVVNMLPFWKKLAAASVLLLLLSAVTNLVFFNKYQTAQKTLTEKEEQLLAIEDSKKGIEADMEVVHNKYSVPVALQGLPAAPDAAAKIFWMKNTGELYVDPSNLPDAPSGKQYQLWAIVDGKPVDAGMILTTKKGNNYRIQKMKSFGKAEAFAITLEKEGGNPTPEGEMYVMGKM